jgi:hypothetical protein
MRLSWSVAGGTEFDPAVLGANGVRAAMTGGGGVCVLMTVIPVFAESPVAPVATIV